MPSTFPPLFGRVAELKSQGTQLLQTASVRFVLSVRTKDVAMRLGQPDVSPLGVPSPCALPTMPLRRGFCLPALQGQHLWAAR